MRSQAWLLSVAALACACADSPAMAGRQLAAGDLGHPLTKNLPSTIDAALEDAARRTGVERTKLEVISAEHVTWPDGSLGCPEPGVLYTMALVPGYRIRIKAGADILDYHASRRGNLVLCPSSRSVDPVPGGPT